MLTAQLQRGKTLFTTLNQLMVLSSPEALVSEEYFFIAIIFTSTQNLSGSTVKVPSMD